MYEEQAPVHYWSDTCLASASKNSQFLVCVCILNTVLVQSHNTCILFRYSFWKTLRWHVNLNVKIFSQSSLMYYMTNVCKHHPTYLICFSNSTQHTKGEWDTRNKNTRKHHIRFEDITLMKLCTINCVHSSTEIPLYIWLLFCQPCVVLPQIIFCSSSLPLFGLSNLANAWATTQYTSPSLHAA